MPLDIQTEYQRLRIAYDLYGFVKLANVLQPWQVDALEDGFNRIYLGNLWATGSRKAVEFSNCLAFLDGAQRTHFDRLEPTFQPILGIFEVRNRPMGTRTQ